MSTIGRVRKLPAFDGIRGIAVIVVVFSHMPQVLDSGLYNAVWQASQAMRLQYIGLDIFFVISGFFITRLLLAERGATGSISLPNFYIRRAIRIFPIYYLTVFACCVIFHFGAADTISLLTYTFNFYHPLVPTPNPLEQAWSLSVEEQFYLAWPFLILVLPLWSASLVTGRIVPILALICGVAMSIWVGTGDQMLSGNLVYMSSLTRMLSLSVGGWLAVREFEERPFSGWPCLGLAVGGILLLLVDRWGRNVGIVASQGFYWSIALASYAALSVGFVGTVVFGTGRVASGMRTALSLPLLRGVGRISYGLYLYHLPVLFYFALNDAALDGGKVPAGTVGLAGAIILMLAVVSYFVIERPLLSLRRESPAPKPADACPPDLTARAQAAE